jgi:hypothetical protein
MCREGLSSPAVKEREERTHKSSCCEVSLSRWLPLLRRELLFFPAGSYQRAFHTNPQRGSQWERLGGVKVEFL